MIPKELPKPISQYYYKGKKLVNMSKKELVRCFVDTCEAHTWYEDKIVLNEWPVKTYLESKEYWYKIFREGERKIIVKINDEIVVVNKPSFWYKMFPFLFGE